MSGASLSRKAAVAAIVVAVCLSVKGLSAQAGPPAGTWESTIRLGEKGERLEPPIFAIYLSDGHFVQLTLPPNRPRLEIPIDEMTRDELLARFRNATLRHGTYSLEGDRLIRTSVADLNPAAEGRTEIDLLTVEPNAFVLKSPMPGNQSEVRFRRMTSRGTANSLVVGVWERISDRNDAGEPRQPANPPRVYYYSPDGFFASFQLPGNRPRADKPLERMTIDELLARFTRVVADAGTYSVLGNRLTRTDTRHTDPSYEGRIEGEVWRIEDDVLVVTSTEPGSKAESRFRRVTR